MVGQHEFILRKTDSEGVGPEDEVIVIVIRML